MSRDWEGGDNYDDNWALDMGRWERNSRAVLRSKRGQQALRELEAALLALPVKRLVADDLCLPVAITDDGEVIYRVCAIGALGLHRGIDPASMAEWNEEGREGTVGMGESLGLRRTLAWVIGETNDRIYRETEEQRYERVLQWIRDVLGVEVAP